MNKNCIDCQTIKDLTAFYKQKASRDGFRANCKTCHIKNTSGRNDYKKQ